MRRSSFLEERLKPVGPLGRRCGGILFQSTIPRGSRFGGGNSESPESSWDGADVALGSTGPDLIRESFGTSFGQCFGLTDGLKLLKEMEV